MKMTLILVILLIFLGGCSTVQESPSALVTNTTNKISGTQELVLDGQELAQLGMTSVINESDRQLFEISNGTDCRTDEEYTNIVDSSLGQYSICVYSIPSLYNTQIIIEFQKFADYEALNGSYLYDTSHLYSKEGLISENDYGDQSRFRVNNEHDYGGQYNQPDIYFYHLWFTKDEYLIHITSKGAKEADGYIENTGRRILSKFG
ncbi:MAG: hypothetical protein V1740_00425 [Candidatus Woesearchaeota archaeon]